MLRSLFPVLAPFLPSSTMEGRVVVSPSMSGEEVASFLDGRHKQYFQRRQQLAAFGDAVDRNNDQLWEDGHTHIRRQRKMINELGIEGAIKETLSPSKPSFRETLRQRPLDRRILEEIYRELHGKRAERVLKKGVEWERWVAKGDGTAPIFSASDGAKRTFGLGGKIKLLKYARSDKEFPICRAPEVAFIGRTNSGKSSLINAVLNAYVCKYGHLQGTTTAASFFSIADQLTIVDLPGYGYYNPISATRLEAENAVQVTKKYLRCASAEKRLRNVKRVFVCVTARGIHDPDVEWIDLLQTLSIPFSVILTKTDRAPIRFLARLADLSRCQLAHYSLCHELMLASSLRLAGISKLQNLIAQVTIHEAKESAEPSALDFDSIV